MTLLALLLAGVPALLPTLGPRPLGVLAGFLADDPRAGLMVAPGELALESGELTLLLGVEDLSLVFAALFLDVLGVDSSSSSSSLGGRDFFLVLLVDILGTATWNKQQGDTDWKYSASQPEASQT